MTIKEISKFFGVDLKVVRKCRELGLLDEDCTIAELATLLQSYNVNPDMQYLEGDEVSEYLGASKRMLKTWEESGLTDPDIELPDDTTFYSMEKVERYHTTLKENMKLYGVWNFYMTVDDLGRKMKMTHAATVDFLSELGVPYCSIETFNIGDFVHKYTSYVVTHEYHSFAQIKSAFGLSKRLGKQLKATGVLIPVLGFKKCYFDASVLHGIQLLGGVHIKNPISESQVEELTGFSKEQLDWLVVNGLLQYNRGYFDRDQLHGIGLARKFWA